MDPVACSSASAKAAPRFRVGITTFGFLFRTTLAQALETIAEAGYRDVEISLVEPHLSTDPSHADRRKLSALLASLGLRCTSLNPPELNLVSPNPEIRELALREYRASIRLCHDLGAPVQMVIPGRRNALIPMPLPDATSLLEQQLAVLLEDAHATGVTLAVETVPFGFIETTAEVADVVRKFSDGLLGIAVDCANTYGREDIAEGVRLAGSDLCMAQFSDTWTSRWAHTSIGRGEVDFDAFRQALTEVGFGGPCIYELVDGEDPAPRIADDLRTLESAGWPR
jgi:sugar phosphate isomerase/epimerase